MRMKKVYLLLICTIFFGTNIAFSQTRGTIKGRIIDSKSKEGLPSVNVKIKGTYYGAAADIEGNYSIPNINPGSYTVEFALLGYTTVQHTDIRIIAGSTLVIDQKMDETVLSISQEVLIIGEKPMFNPEQTSSVRSVSSEDLKVTLIENVTDVVSQQVGVVQTDKEIHIRGGRTNENAYLLDGVSIQDPLAGTGFGLQLSADAVEEVQVITGGFNAEYGQATSGVVNVTTKTGSERYTGSIGYRRDHIGFDESIFRNFNTDAYDGSLSGPEPITSLLLPSFGISMPGSLTFFSNFSGSIADGYTRRVEIIQDGKPTGRFRSITAGQLNSSIFGETRFAPRTDNNWFLLGKLTWHISALMRLTYSYNHSVSINQNSQSLQTNLEYVEASPGYQYEFQNILNDANVYTHDNQFHSIGWTHTLSNQLFYELKLSHYFTHLRADANGQGYRLNPLTNKIEFLYTEPKDIVTFPISYYNTTHDTIGVVPGDGLWDYGNASTWHDHYVSENSAKFDLTYQISETNKMKTGFDLSLKEMQNIDIYQPWSGSRGLNNDIYFVKTTSGALYAQDNILFSGMILNIGLRFDYWFPGDYVDNAVNDTNVATIPQKIRDDYHSKTYNFFGHRWKGRISPRIGISHPVSDNQMLFFSYGHFSKQPKPQFVYAKLDPTTSKSSFQKFGNPDLDPETTVEYQLGLQTQFTSNDVLTVTAYYKDIFDYISTKPARITSSRISSGSFVTYVNQDYASSRGIEMEFRKRIERWFRGSISGSYSITTGKSSSADQGLLVARGIQDETVKENYMPWDRPFQFNLATTFNVLKDEPLFGFGQGILDNYSVYFNAFYQSGKRYTPSIQDGLLANGRPNYVSDTKNLYGTLGEYWFWIDMNVEKYFKWNRLEFTFSVKIRNILDNKNSAIINPVTGKAYDYGDPTPSSWNDPLYPDLQAPVSAYPYNAARYLAGRNLQVGFSLKF